MLAAVPNLPALANIEEEAALLGAMLHERSLIDSIADRVKPEHFYEALHGRIFEAILKLHSEGKTASPITLKPLFADDPAIKDVGGPSYLVTIMGSSGSSVIGAKDFADDIRELAQRRKLVDGLKLVIQEGSNQAVALPDLVSATEATLSEATEQAEQSVQVTAAEAVSRVLNSFGKRDNGVTSGIDPIDYQLGPILPGHIAVVAGRPSMGKSAVASSYALGAASRGHGVLFVSLEMSAEELGERIAADMCFDTSCQVPYSAITEGRVTADQGRQVARCLERLEQMPLSIVDIGGCSISRLGSLVRRHARRMKARGKKLELLVVDYLQLVRPDRHTENRTQEITQVSMGLRAIAKEHRIGIMALAQLSRSVEQRADKRPIMADLRESGQIEQDADSIMFLFREEYYLKQAEPAPNDPNFVKWQQLMDDARGRIEFIVAKRRRGCTGASQGRFYGAFQAVRG